MALTRAKEFQELRRLLCGPKEQCPSNDTLVSNLIAAEQTVLNRQNNTKRVWSHNTATITTVANQAEYTPTVAGNDSFGKPFFVYRDYGNNNIVPIPYADYEKELHNQSYEFFVVPPEAPTYSNFFGFSAVKIAFFRNEAQPRARIYPVPETAGIVYQIIHSVGRAEWANFAWADTPTVPEHSRFRVTIAALASIRSCEWDAHTVEQNIARRREIRDDLKDEYRLLDAEFEDFLRNPQNEPDGDCGNWWE